MNVQLDIIVLLLSGLVVLAVGLFLGYRLALSRLEDRFQDVAEKEKTLLRDVVLPSSESVIRSLLHAFTGLRENRKARI